MTRLRLAIVGCGQVTEAFHLPVASRSTQVQVTALVDKSLPRARQLAERYTASAADAATAPAAVDDYRQIEGRADAAIVALPNHLHAPVANDLLRRGLHVLVEKPMALSASQCDEMIATADDAGAVLAVGLVRRFYRPSQFVKRAISCGLLGTIRSFDLREGAIYRWPVVSDAMFRRESAGGGVLIDIGPHALDLLLWWLGDWEHVTYHDDAAGGVEADCRVDLTLKSGVSGTLELSRTRDLRNSWIIRGERATLHVGTGYNAPIRLQIDHDNAPDAPHLADPDVALAGQAQAETTDAKIHQAFARQLDDLIDSIRNRRQPLASGQEGKRALQLIDACYAARQPLEWPWDPPRAVDTEPDRASGLGANREHPVPEMSERVQS